MTHDPATRPIRVLIVDDSAFMRTALSRMISAESGLEVAGTASCGSEALDKIVALDPDVVTLDVEMPGLDGLQTLRHIMSHFPRPVIMVSAVTEKDAENTFNALAAGAFDYVPKQLSAASLDIIHIRPDLIAKIRTAAQSRNPGGAATTAARKPPQSSEPESRSPGFAAPAIVALGTSTGGPKALQEILPLAPPRPFGPNPDRAAHACRLYRALCATPEHSLLRPCAGGISPRTHSAGRGLHRSRWNAHEREALV